jgi:hypothetical protein
MMSQTTTRSRASRFTVSAQLAAETEALNRRYLATVNRRALCGTAIINEWQGEFVNVFLRHESDHVFAVAAADRFGMADYVGIECVSFFVDEAGRRQACQGQGSLPNGRNVHAWVRGRLLWASMQSRLTPTSDWQAVIYNPHSMMTFQYRDTGIPVHHASTVFFTPKPATVWCLPCSGDLLSEAVQ